MNHATGMDELVSIVMSNYNHGRYLRQAVDSVLAQTWERFELIIVDDGSTDSSREILETYSDSRIKKIYQQNAGQAAAMNRGFECSIGRYVAFMDSDDFWKPAKLETCISQFRLRNYSVVQHRLAVVDAGGRPSGAIHPRLKPGARNVLAGYFNEHCTGFFSATSGLVCRRSDLMAIFPLDTAWGICADVALTRPLALFGDIFTVPEVLGCYRVHDSNHWMGSESQADYINNERKFCEYTLSWTRRFGYTREIDFQRSELFWTWKRMGSLKGEKLGLPDRLIRLYKRMQRKFHNRVSPEYF